MCLSPRFQSLEIPNSSPSRLAVVFIPKTSVPTWRKANGGNHGHFVDAWDGPHTVLVFLVTWETYNGGKGMETWRENNIIVLKTFKIVTWKSRKLKNIEVLRLWTWLMWCLSPWSYKKRCVQNRFGTVCLTKRFTNSRVCLTWWINTQVAVWSNKDCFQLTAKQWNPGSGSK